MMGDQSLMTQAQAEELEELSRQTGEEVPDGLTEAAASERINELRSRVGREDDAPAPLNTPVSPNANR